MPRKLNPKLSRPQFIEGYSPPPDLTGVKIDPQPRTKIEAQRIRAQRSVWIRNRVNARIKRGMSESEALATASLNTRKAKPPGDGYTYSVRLDEETAVFFRMLGGGNLRAGMMLSKSMSEAMLRTERADGIRILDTNGKEYTP